ncbi:bifunctional helix-turn-helix transcriptional regulator/GNAT family N-acetyltransferase [Leptolyngbya sp. FACHB-261]|uniref:bifunctional helix-turn-helix transcriptional regulator/GNAT family N-acetyltransferase n=1 Tax=Leptolyngbya sp. FACHB-261 TaxID=2692806 RepID=UPI001682BF66|nr:bifunctional helix-turn-helix transcriptional regulator/GNAT family N-acetyltransferase [Leptolyngbya sp. FACHB-261]MBD2102336.1 GNAT family N-acetyltransferase [Leptolyngbya sp. FACHB-261]
MDFYFQAGKVALGSRLRRLSEKLTEDAAKIYALYDVALDPKWFPVFYVLSHRDGVSVTEIAQIIGHSHPSVSQIVKEMNKKGLTVVDKDIEDARVSVVRLSDVGKQLVPKIEKQYIDVTQAVDGLLSEAQQDLWQAIEEVEFLLADKSFFDRVKDMRKARERQHIEIIAYSPEFQDDFKRLNCEWIETYFKLEESDYQALNHPDEKILQPGGHIYMARHNGEIIGTCALIKVDSNTYELAKMAVTERARSKGVGWLLGQAAINKASELEARTIYLESNTVLEPAIRLYQKLGFQRVIGQTSPYQRCNIRMELKLVQQHR